MAATDLDSATHAADATANRRVLLTDFAWPDVAIERDMLAAAGLELVVAPASDEPALIAAARSTCAILTCWARVTASVIDACSGCRTVGRMGIGLDNIDVAHCTARGIPVTNVPAYCVDEVAEHALALIFALGRNIGYFHQRTKNADYTRDGGASLRRIAGQTLGIIGFGRIGRALARRAFHVGFRALVFNHSAITTDLPLEHVPLNELLARSDYVSLHLPLTDQTRHLIDTGALARMKPTAFLINTARGGLIDHAALADALAAGRLGGAGLDVQDPEPPDLSLPLYRDERVIVTPHAAFASEESLLELRRTAVSQVLEVFAGRLPDNVVNPIVYR